MKLVLSKRRDMMQAQFQLIANLYVKNIYNLEGFLTIPVALRPEEMLGIPAKFYRLFLVHSTLTVRLQMANYAGHG